MFLQGLGSDLIAKVSTHLVDKREFGRLLVTCTGMQRILKDELQKRKKAWKDVRLLQLLHAFRKDEDEIDKPDSLFRMHFDLDVIPHRQEAHYVVVGTGMRTLSVVIITVTQHIILTIYETAEHAQADPDSPSQLVGKYEFCIETTLCGAPDGKFVGVGFLTPSPENPVTIASQIITSVDDLIRLTRSNALGTGAIVMPE